MNPKKIELKCIIISYNIFNDGMGGNYVFLLTNDQLSISDYGTKK